MTQENGLGHELYVDGWDLSDDIGSVSRIGGGPASLDVTGIRSLAHERLGGLRDGSIEASAHFNPTNAHTALAELPRSPRIVSYLTGTSVGRPAACLHGPQPNYDGTRGADAALSYAWGVQGSRFGLEWGDVLAGRAEHTAADTTTGLDNGSSTAFGLQAYLHVHALTGDDVTVTVEDSADGSSWAPLADGVFDQVTSAPAALRLQTARDATVRQHLRVSTAGTFTAVTFSVVAVRNVVAVDF